VWGVGQNFLFWAPAPPPPPPPRRATQQHVASRSVASGLVGQHARVASGVMCVACERVSARRAVCRLGL
jgi:hypothetical protein